MTEGFGIRRTFFLELPHRGAVSAGLNLRLSRGVIGETRQVVPGILDTLLVQSDPVRFGIMDLLDASGGMRSRDLEPKLNGLPYTKNRQGSNVLGQSSIAHLMTELRDRGVVKKREGKKDRIELTDYGKESMKAYDEYYTTVSRHSLDLLLKEAREALGERLFTRVVDDLSKPQAKEADGQQARPFNQKVAEIMALQGDPKRLSILLAIDGASGLSFQPVVQAIRTANNFNFAQSTVSNMITDLGKAGLLIRAGGNRKPEYTLTDLGKVSMQGFRAYHDRLVDPLVECWRQCTNARFGTNIPPFQPTQD